MNVFAPNRILTSGPLGVLILICALPVILAGCAAGPANSPPTASAGTDQVVDAGASVTLDGSASTDPDGDTISFSWKQTLGTPVSLSSTSAPTATFTAPAKGTTLAFELTVSDGQSDSTAKANVAVRLVDSSVQVEERAQRSVTEDAAAMGNFPNDWLIADAGAGLPPPPADDLELNEFVERFEGVRVPRIVQEELAPGATRTVSLDIAGPSGLAGQAQWIGTTAPLNVTIALDGSTLATGSAYQMGHDRGGSYLSAQTTAGGLASISVTNTSDVAVIVRIIFGTRGL